MARGKYAQRAADKRAELEVTTDLASYQHRVARLTAENRELRETLDSERAAHKKVQRRLRAERDEGVAPQVEALTLALNACREGKEQAEATARREREIRIKVQEQVIAHFVKGHDASFEQASGWFSVAAHGFDPENPPEDMLDKSLTPEQQLALQHRNRKALLREATTRPSRRL